MLGRSSRFFKAGYTVPKYKLPLWQGTVFSYCVKTFEKYFQTDTFIFLVRQDYEAINFVAEAAAAIGIKDFRVKQIDFETAGQAESVYLGVKDMDENAELIIFNIDTIRTGFTKPEKLDFGDGFLEVFEADGDAWSFVETIGDTNRVSRTTEKDRISNKCSNGLYGFKSVGAFKKAYNSYRNMGNTVNGEVYIAPIYNLMLADGADIRAILVPSDEVLNCGVPEDYERLCKQIK